MICHYGEKIHPSSVKETHKTMFLQFIIKKLRYLSYRLKVQRGGQQPEQPGRNKEPLSKKLEKNLEQVHRVLGDSGDVKVHRFALGNAAGRKAALFYIDGLVNLQLITDTILAPLMVLSWDEDARPLSMDTLRFHMLFSSDITQEDDLDTLIDGCLQGDTVLLVDGLDQGLIITTKGWDKRSVTEPQSESVVRGPREGFTENLRTNTALMRRRIKSPQLRMDHMVIGQKTRTDVCVVYIDGVADPGVVDTLKKRLQAIQIDSVLDTGYLEQYIEDAPFSPFATVAYSEKPDVAAGRILEGRVGIIADGSPFVLTVPMLFIESFQSGEDYYVRTFYASMIRILRFIAFFISVFAPAIYIALTTFHQELIPTTLLFTIASAREGTPFPSFIEAAVMVFSYEILREAGVRLPRPVGQAISIVGALIMGDAAVSAGIVGAPMVITIAITAVAGFVVPDQNNAASPLRIGAMLMATVLGGYGITIFFLWLLIHLASLKSFGVPYFSGFAISRDLEDSFVRMPLWSMIKRPRHIAEGDIVRRRGIVRPDREDL